MRLLIWPSLALTLLLQSPAFADFDGQLRTAGKRLRDTVAEFNIGGRVKLLDININDFAHLRLVPEFDTYLNRDKVTFSRSEKWVLERGVTPHTPGPVRFGVGLERGTEIEFIRQFNTQGRALNLVSHPPYSIDRLPKDSVRALELAPGDYTRFQTRMALSVGTSLAQSLGFAQVTGGNSYIVYGDFQIEVYRKQGSVVGVRVSNLQKRSLEFFLGVRHSRNFDFFEEVFSTSSNANIVRRTLNHEIVKELFPDQIIDFRNVRAKGSLISIEYDFDLAFRDSREAFEKIVNPEQWEFQKFIQLKRGNVYIDNSMLVASLDHADALNGVHSQGRYLVQKKFNGQSQFEEQSRGLEISLPSINFNRRSSFVEQNFKFHGVNSEMTYLKLAQLTLYETAEALFSLIGREQQRDSNILYQTDENENITDFHEINFSYERREKTHFANERALIQGQVYKMTPEAYHKALDLGEIANGIMTRDLNIYMVTTIHKNGFDLIGKLSQAELNYVIDKFYWTLAEDQRKPLSHKYGRIFLTNDEIESEERGRGVTVNTNSRNWKSRADKYIGNFKIGLAQALLDQSGLTLQQRWEILKELSKNNLYRQIGSGTFARLAEYAARKNGMSFAEVASFDLRMASKKGNKQLYIGQRGMSDLMRKVTVARDRILGRKLDPVFWGQNE